jgi:hypothetical protein
MFYNKDMTETKAFQVGRTYYCRSFCDYDCVWQFTVAKRTAKFVTLDDGRGEVRRVGVRVWDNVEACSPLGTYSMAPVLTAEKEVVSA